MAMDEKTYNPLDKKNLGESVADALLERPPIQLKDIVVFEGAGVYAIYYKGKFPAYAESVRKGYPIYVGKAVPKGGRRGDIALGAPVGPVLYARLREHAESIRQAENLNLDDFWCRYLVVDDIWIPLGETLLIQKYQPTWNHQLPGFGIHDPGGGRYQQQRSDWDTVHPGRAWAMRCKPNARESEILATWTGKKTTKRS